MQNMLKDKIHRIIVLIPGKNARGGIANYYNALFNHLPSNYLGIERGSRNWPDQQNNLGTFCFSLIFHGIFWGLWGLYYSKMAN